MGREIIMDAIIAIRKGGISPLPCPIAPFLAGKRPVSGHWGDIWHIIANRRILYG